MADRIVRWMWVTLTLLLLTCPVLAVTFSGFVYDGDVGDTGFPVVDVMVNLYCSNTYGVQGTFVSLSVTNRSGFYTLEGPASCEYYNILLDVPSRATAVAAKSSAGSVLSSTWITYPLRVVRGSTVLTENVFWIKTTTICQETCECLSEDAAKEKYLTFERCSRQICGYEIPTVPKYCVRPVRTLSVPVDGTPCDDGNLCTIEDTYQNGICEGGTLLTCDDQNPDTTDTCDPARGCTFVPMGPVNGISCDDGNLCTIDDVYQQGVCKGGLPLICNDQNPNTTDSCEPAHGCVYRETVAGAPIIVTILPSVPGPRDRVTITASYAGDAADITDPHIEIFVNGAVVHVCEKRECSFVGGPYPDGFITITRFRHIDGIMKFTPPKDLRSDQEVCLNTDQDCDGIPNTVDNCPTVKNTDQKDTNKNGIGDACEPYLKLLFVPLDWSGSQASFNTSRDEQVGFFLNATDLHRCPRRVALDALQVSTQNLKGFNGTTSEVRTFATGLGINTANYDVIVGLGAQTPGFPLVGLSNKIDCVWVNVSYPTVMSHELGHIFGLGDEYCSNPAGSTDCYCNDGDQKFCGNTPNDGAQTGDVNWLDANLGCNATGWPCCNWDANHNCGIRNYNVCCRGNANTAGGRCVMSYADAPDPRAFCQHCQEFLTSVDQLQCHSPEPVSSNRVVEIHLLVYQNDTVLVDSIKLREGRPSLSPPLEGNYQIMVRDAAERSLYSALVDLNFAYTGPVIDGFDYSTIRFDPVSLDYKVPFTEGMERLELSHDGRVIFSTHLDFCNRNQICNPMETFETCPSDCPLNRNDGICIPTTDNVCDPDCWTGIDADCKVPLTSLETSKSYPPTQTPLSLGVVIAAFLVVMLMKRRYRRL